MLIRPCTVRSGKTKAAAVCGKIRLQEGEEEL